MPWEINIRDFYPTYIRYCKEVLHTNHVSLGEEDIITWYRAIEWAQKQPIIEPTEVSGAPDD